MSELALRPEFSAPSPNATNGAICATRREAGVTGFDCGVGVPLLRALPHRPGGRRLNLIERAGVLALFLPRGPNRGTGRREHDDPEATGLGGAQARRVQSRIAVALAGSRCPTPSERPASGRCSDRGAPGRSERSRRHVPDAIVRLAGPADAAVRMSGVQDAPTRHGKPG